MLEARKGIFMHTESIDKDTAMLFYECYSKWDGNNITELCKSMGNDEIDALYTIAEGLYCNLPNFKTEAEKYSLNNVKSLINDFFAECIYFTIDMRS